MSEEVDLKRENSEQELYKPPPEKSLSEILDSDKNDESLQLYKEKLLGSAAKDVIVSWTLDRKWSFQMTDLRMESMNSFSQGQSKIQLTYSFIATDHRPE